MHSPDAQYAEKVAYIQRCSDLVKSDPAQYVLVYLDEFSFYRQPSLGNDYTARETHVAPLARRSYLSDSSCRGIGALDALSGQLTYAQHSRLSTRRIAQFYHTLAHAYPQAKTIFVVQDNWAVHYHPDILAPLYLRSPLSSRPFLPSGRICITLICQPVNCLFRCSFCPPMPPGSTLLKKSGAFCVKVFFTFIVWLMLGLNSSNVFSISWLNFILARLTCFLTLAFCLINSLKTIRTAIPITPQTLA